MAERKTRKCDDTQAALLPTGAETGSRSTNARVSPRWRMVGCGALVLVVLFYILFVHASENRATVVFPEVAGPTVKVGTARMPALGFGTCCRASARGEPLIESIKAYLELGGRHIDTAQMYGNHVDVGKAIRDSGIDRSKIWITSKLNTYVTLDNYIVNAGPWGRDTTKTAVEACLKDLGMNHVELMLIHGRDAAKLPDEQLVDVWKGLIDEQRAGHVLHIGVSNFNVQEIQMLERATGKRPEVNEINTNPWTNKDVVEWCQENNVAVIAYGSLGGAGAKEGDGNKYLATGVLHETDATKVVADIAAAHSATVAQVMLRWALDRGLAVIPGATSRDHILENLETSTKCGTLSKEEMTRMENAPQPLDEWSKKHK